MTLPARKFTSLLALYYWPSEPRDRANPSIVDLFDTVLKEERLACIADACHLCRDNIPVEYHARISTWRHSTKFGEVPCSAGKIRERMGRE